MHKITKQKGFTLIEILVVMAIIGIAASIVIVNTSVSLQKAKDSNIILTANSIMKLAQVDCLYSGNYTKWGERDIVPMQGILNSVFIDNYDQCAGKFGATSSPPSVRAACQGILKSNGSLPGTTDVCSSGGMPCLMITGLGFSLVKLTVMAWLPGKNTYYCIGSNGKTSVAPLIDNGDGTFYPDFAAPGCLSDASGGD